MIERRGETRGRALLQTLRDRMEGTVETVRPYFATVTEVSGDLVRVRTADATSASRPIAKAKGTPVPVGTRGVVIPTGDGGLSFVPLGAQDAAVTLASLGSIAKRLATTPTTQGGGAGNFIPDLIVPMVGGETWTFDVWLSTYHTGGAGLRFGVWAPAGSSIVAHIEGSTTAPAVRDFIKTTTNNALAAKNFNAYDSNNAYVRIVGSVVAAASGNLSFIWGVVTAGQTGYVDAGSWMRAVRA